MTKKEAVEYARKRLNEGATEEELFGELFELTEKSEPTIVGYVKAAKDEIEMGNALEPEKSKGFDDPFAKYVIKDNEKDSCIMIVENIVVSDTELEGEYPNERPKRLSKPYILRVNPMFYRRRFLSGDYKRQGLTVHKVIWTPKGVEDLDLKK
jgi:hypothetical protein